MSDTLDTAGPSDAWAAAQDDLALEAYELKSQGLTLSEIGAQQGASPALVAARVKRGSALLPGEDLSTAKALQVRALERQKRVVLGVMARPGYKVDHGKVVMDPVTRNPDGSQKPLVDQEMVLKASAELRRIEDSIARLKGTRAPIAREMGELSEDALNAEFRRLLERGAAIPIDARVSDSPGGGPAALAAPGAVGGDEQGGEARVPTGAQAG